MGALSAVVFDWYNTLAAPHADDFWTRLPDLIAGAGGDPDPVLLREWDTGHPVEHRRHSASEADYRDWQRRRFERLLERCGVEEPYLTQLVDEVEHLRHTRLFDVFDDAVEVLTALRARGFATGICSNWDWDLARHLRHNDVERLVDFVVCSAIHGYRKPHAAIFAAVRAHVGRPAETIVFVGDSWHDDVAGATSAGLRAVHVSRDDACVRSPHPEVPCVQDLRSLLALV